jgi:hypothetical protein
MPISYACDQCGTTAPSLDGWLIVQISFIHVMPNAPPPGGRTLDAMAPDLFFHTAACRDAWLGAAGIPAPPTAP